MAVSIPDLCRPRPDPGRRVFGPRPPVVRLITSGSEPVSRIWHEREMSNPFWRFYVVDRPGLHLVHAGIRLDYPADGVTVIPGWCRFRFFMQRGVSHAYIHAEIPAWPEGLVRSLAPRPYVVHDSDLSRRMLAHGRDVGYALRPDAELAARAVALATEAIASLAGPSCADGSRLAPALALIESRLDRPLRIADIAAVLGVGTARCTRLFRVELGQSPLQYLLARRVARAADLLQSGRQRLDEIARACGFPDRCYLSRVFRQRIGLPPARYRLQA